MKIYFFLFAYSFLILSYFLVGNMTLGGVSLIMISELLTIMTCLLIDWKIVLDRYLLLYVIFLFIRLFSESYYGYSEDLFEDLKRYLPAAFVLCWSSAVFTKHFNGYYYLFLVVPLIFAGVLNSFVTYCQANGILGAEFLKEALNTTNEEEMSYILRRGDRFGLAVSGVYSTALQNGHRSLFMLVAMFLLRRNNVLSILTIVIAAIILVGLFLCQERSALFFGLIFVALMIMASLYINGHKKWLVTIFVMSVLIIPSVIAYLVSLDTRVTDVNLDNRSDLWEYSIMYISDHIIMGSYYQYIQVMHKPPHNLFLSAFVAGGLIGGGYLILFLALQLRSMYRLLKRDRSNDTLVIMCIYLSMVGDSLFHNLGLVEFNPATLLGWGLVLGLLKRNKYEVIVRRK